MFQVVYSCHKHINSFHFDMSHKNCPLLYLVVTFFSLLRRDTFPTNISNNFFFLSLSNFTDYALKLVSSLISLFLWVRGSMFLGQTPDRVLLATNTLGRAISLWTSAYLKLVPFRCGWSLQGTGFCLLLTIFSS